MHYGFGGFGGIGGFGMILVWAAIIVVIVVLVRMFTSSSHHDEHTSRTPIEILKRRYASGEISKEEFEEKKHDLVG
jgi:putative membrane protein